MTLSTDPTGFLGLSHLGIVSSIGWGSFGQPVIGVDPDTHTVERLVCGDLPVLEPGLPELLERNRQWLTFSSDITRLSACPLVIVSRDVPTDATNTSDLTPVLDLIDSAIPHLCPDVVLVVMSQVPPGFTRALGERIRKIRPDLLFQLYYWVETLIFGDAVRRCLEPERFIVGCADPRALLPPMFAEGLKRFGCPILPMIYESAELTKTAINLYLVGSVTYANLLADLCESLGADWAEMVPALRLDKRIGPAAYLRPSLGIAGGNLERDLITLKKLCQTHSVDAVFLEGMIEYNTRRYQWVHHKLIEHVLTETVHPVVGIWGLAYKKNTRSTKNSIALRVINDLRGHAEIRAYDPVVTAVELDVPAKIVGQRDEVLTGADCLLILTDWDEFAVLRAEALRTMRRPIVIDCVGVVDRARVDLRGVSYVSMGRAKTR